VEKLGRILVKVVLAGLVDELTVRKRVVVVGVYHLSGCCVEGIDNDVVVMYVDHSVVLGGFQCWLSRHGGSSYGGFGNGGLLIKHLSGSSKKRHSQTGLAIA
jgi:hypothetical protein